MEIINTDKAPRAIGPYSQGVEAKSIIYTSGQLPVNAQTGEIPEGIVGQAEQSCINVGEILKEAGGGFKDVIKTTCFLTDMSFFSEFNKIYEKYFISKPARSCVAVKELPKNVLCEIEAIAIKCKETNNE